MQGGQSPYLFTNKDTFKDTKVGQGIIYRGLLIREVVSFMCYYMHASNVRLFIWNMCTLCTIPEMDASNVRLFIRNNCTLCMISVPYFFMRLLIYNLGVFDEYFVEFSNVFFSLSHESLFCSSCSFHVFH